MRCFAKIKYVVTLGLFFIILLFISSVYAETDLGTVPIQINLTNQPKITVEKPEGGWYDTLELTNQSGADVKLYKVNIPVRISIRNEQNFKVSLAEELILVHKLNSSLKFTVEKIGFGPTVYSQHNLSIDPTPFVNPPLMGDESVGDYILSIVARQPEGQIGNISGHYSGTLTLIFEVDI